MGSDPQLPSLEPHCALGEKPLPLFESEDVVVAAHRKDRRRSRVDVRVPDVEESVVYDERGDRAETGLALGFHLVHRRVPLPLRVVDVVLGQELEQRDEARSV